MRKLTVNIGKVPPSTLVLNLIRRGVAAGCFPWPETAWTRFLREQKEKDSAAMVALAKVLPAKEPVDVSAV